MGGRGLRSMTTSPTVMYRAMPRAASMMRRPQRLRNDRSTTGDGYGIGGYRRGRNGRNRTRASGIFQPGLGSADRAVMRGRIDHRHATDRYAWHYYQYVADRRARRHGAGARSAAGVRALSIDSHAEPRAVGDFRLHVRSRQRDAAADRHTVRDGPNGPGIADVGRRLFGDAARRLFALPHVRQ